MKNDTKSSSNFRSDINGLRAWAVVAVILFHFSIPGFSGGFVGVDIFFVISGFLMTGIIIRGLEKEKFNIVLFYVARAKRIIPALVAVCGTLLFLGWWLVLNVDYKTLGAHVVSSLLFVSNIKYARESGYFDSNSHEKWLLHTWSLSAEWQFYLVLPVAILLIWKVRPGRKFAAFFFILASALSLGFSLIQTESAPTQSFFLLPTRAWEMLAGGLVFLLTDSRKTVKAGAKILTNAGLLLLIISILFFDSFSPWPSWRALIPVIGTCLVLWTDQKDTIWTNAKILQWFGTRSYSLYLWHWPVVVALIYTDSPATLWVKSLGIIFTFFLGHLSFKFIEAPSRDYFSRVGVMTSSSAIAAGVLVVLLPASLVYFQKFSLNRFNSEIDKISSEAVNVNPRQAECHGFMGSTSPSCTYGGKTLKAVVMGDSHADALLSAVVAAKPNSDDSVLQWTYAACPTLIGAHAVRELPNAKCHDYIDWAIDSISKIPKNIPVIIINRHAQYALGQNEDLSKKDIPWVYFSKVYKRSEPEFLREYAKNITDTACTLSKDRRVFLIRPIPEMGVNVPRTARFLIWGQQRDVNLSLDSYHERNNFIWAAQDKAKEQCGVEILDPIPYLCKNGTCNGSVDGRPIYFDDDHLSEFGNKFLVPMFKRVFEARD